MIKISIIVPVYNVEKYIEKCLDSLIDQKLNDIEIICVDDGSTDSCPAILDSYAETDSRVKVIHKPNGGYGKAMNIGFEAAQGEYIGIVESDDFTHPDMYETLYSFAAQNDLDVVKSDFNFYWSDGNTYFNSHKKEYEQYYNKILKDSDKSILFSFAPSNWSGIYKRDFIKKNNIQHHETPGASYQDTGFWFQIIAMAESAAIIDKAFYMYRQDNPASSMKRKDKMMDFIKECEWARSVLGSGNYEHEIRYTILHQLKIHSETLKRIDDSLKSEYVNIIKNDYLKCKDKVIDLLKLEQNRKTYEWLELVSEAPEEVCCKVIQEKNNFMRMIDSAEKLIVYGAGRRAVNVCSKLKDIGAYDKVCCIAVTGVPESEYFFGKPLKCIDEIAEKDASVLIAVKSSSGMFNEIKDKLDSLNIKNTFDTEIIRDI